MRIVSSLLLSAGFAALSVAEEAAVTPTQPAAAPVVAEPIAAQQAAPLSPSGLPINDLRFTFGLSVTDDVELDLATAETDGDLDSWAASIQFMRSLGPWNTWGGMIYGAELFYSYGDGSLEPLGGPGEITLRVSTYGLTGFLGWGHQLASQPIHFEGTLFGTVGKSTTEIALGSEGLDASDYLHAYGLRAASYWTFSDRHQLGLDVRYTLESETTPTFTAGGDSASAELTNSGLSIALGAGYRY